MVLQAKRTEEITGKCNVTFNEKDVHYIPKNCTACTFIDPHSIDASDCKDCFIIDTSNGSATPIKTSIAYRNSAALIGDHKGYETHENSVVKNDELNVYIGPGKPVSKNESSKICENAPPKSNNYKESASAKNEALNSCNESQKNLSGYKTYVGKNGMCLQDVSNCTITTVRKKKSQKKEYQSKQKC